MRSWITFNCKFPFWVPGSLVVVVFVLCCVWWSFVVRSGVCSFTVAVPVHLTEHLSNRNPFVLYEMCVGCEKWCDRRGFALNTCVWAEHVGFDWGETTPNPWSDISRHHPSGSIANIMPKRATKETLKKIYLIYGTQHVKDHLWAGLDAKSHHRTKTTEPPSMLWGHFCVPVQRSNLIA